VSAVEARLAEEAELIEEPIDDEELAMERMEAGLFTLQCCMVITAALWSTGDVGLRKRLLQQLHQRGQALEMVR
jgi:beta-catenin-like protein 1